MAAVVGPVGVDHAQLGDGGITVLSVTEVCLTELDVAQIHGKTVFIDKLLQLLFRELGEAVQCLDGGGNGVVGVQRLRLLHGCLTALHRIDEVRFQTVELCVGEIAGDDEYLCGADTAAFALQQDLDALFAAVCTLVKLSRQIFGGEHALTRLQCRQLSVDVVYSRLREYRGDGTLECFFRQMICVIAVEDPDVRHIQTKGGLQVAEHSTCFYGELCFLLNINTRNGHGKTPFLS